MINRRFRWYEMECKLFLFYLFNMIDRSVKSHKMRTNTIYTPSHSKSLCEISTTHEARGCWAYEVSYAKICGQFLRLWWRNWKLYSSPRCGKITRTHKFKGIETIVTEHGPWFEWSVCACDVSECAVALIGVYASARYSHFHFYFHKTRDVTNFRCKNSLCMKPQTSPVSATRRTIDGPKNQNFWRKGNQMRMYYV